LFALLFAGVRTGRGLCNMPYQHDVFISYRRDRNWTPWTREHFKDLLQTYLHDDLYREPDIFLDERIEVGADWVDELGGNLAQSKVVVALFSGSYFDSDWCVHELDLIVERARQFKGGFFPERRLIIPVVAHDGEQIPDPVARIQKADISKFRVVGLSKGAPLFSEFSEVVKKLSPPIAIAVNNAPEFEDNWVAFCKKRFVDVYEAIEKGIRLPPTQFILKAAPPLRVPQLKPKP
jgi:hypothetical protein